MADNLKTTIRLKKGEASVLKDLAFELTKEAINLGKRKVYTEADIVHFAIEIMSKIIAVDENGDLAIQNENVYTTTQMLGMKPERKKSKFKGE